MKWTKYDPENPQYEMWVIRLLEIAKRRTFFGLDGIPSELGSVKFNYLRKTQSYIEGLTQ